MVSVNDPFLDVRARRVPVIQDASNRQIGLRSAVWAVADWQAYPCQMAGAAARPANAIAAPMSQPRTDPLQKRLKNGPPNC